MANFNFNKVILGGLLPIPNSERLQPEFPSFLLP